MKIEVCGSDPRDLRSAAQALFYHVGILEGTGRERAAHFAPLIAAVSKLTGADVEQWLFTKDRQQHLVLARKIFWYVLLRRGLGYERTASIGADWDHTTVVRGVQRFTRSLAQRPELARKVEALIKEDV